MIEPVMYVAIGFLVACMLIIGIIPVVHARAVRLTTRRLEAVTPMSMAEIQADKDQLRAEFAMSTRRLEMSVDQMKTEDHQPARRDRQEERGDRPDQARARRKDRHAVRARSQGKAAHRRPARDAAAARREDRGACRRRSACWKKPAPSSPPPRSTANDSALTVDSQRVELVTARAQIEVLKGQIESYDKESRELHERLTIETTAADATRQALTVRDREVGGADQPRHRARAPGHRADHRGRSARAPRAGAARPGRRAGPLPLRARADRRIRCAPKLSSAQQTVLDAARRAGGSREPPPHLDRGARRPSGSGSRASSSNRRPSATNCRTRSCR